MLTPEWLDQCPDDLVTLYDGMIDDIVRDIVRRLMNTNFEITQSAVWQAEVLQSAGLTFDDVMENVARITGKQKKELKKIFLEGGTKTLAHDDAIYRAAGLDPIPLSQSASMTAILNAGAAKCSGELVNLTRTMAISEQNNFVRVLDRAHMDIISGAFDYNSAIIRAVKTLSDNAEWVLYPSGARSRVDVAVRRAALTGVSQTCGQMQEARMDELNCELVETSAHIGARPSHAEWQGRVFSYKGRNKKYPDFEQSTGYGTVTGLMGANCRHSFSPFFEGISTRAYTDKELKELASEAVTVNGKDVPVYEATQQQRAMERDIRSQKRRLLALEEAGKDAGDDAAKAAIKEEFGKESLKLKEKERSLNDFIRQTNLPDERARVQVEGFGRSISSKAVSAAKNQEKVFTIGGNGGIINAGVNNLIQQVNDIAKRDTTFKELTLDEFKAMKGTATKAERSIIYGHDKKVAYINSSEAKYINADFRNGVELTGKRKQIAETLSNVIAKNEIPEDITVFRNVDGGAFKAITGVDIPTASLKKPADVFWRELDNLPSKIKVGEEYKEKGFLSTSAVEGKNVFGDRLVKINIKVPRGTKGYVTTNNKESEIVFGTGTKLRIDDCQIVGSRKPNWKVILNCTIVGE